MALPFDGVVFAIFNDEEFHTLEKGLVQVVGNSVVFRFDHVLVFVVLEPPQLFMSWDIVDEEVEVEGWFLYELFTLVVVRRGMSFHIFRSLLPSKIPPPPPLEVDVPSSDGIDACDTNEDWLVNVFP